MIQHYARLRLQPGASPEEIKSSFRRMAKKFHPDSSGGNAVLFGRVKEAYDALSNEERRIQFEQLYKKIMRPRERKRAGGMQGGPVDGNAPPSADGGNGKHYRSTPGNGAGHPGARNPGAGSNGAGNNGAGNNGAGNNGAGSNGAGSNGAGSNGAGHNGARNPGAGNNGARSQGAGAKAGEPVVSRLMSIATPRSGNLFFRNLHAQIIVEQTRPDNLWETTLRKFRTVGREKLSAHVIQIKVTGRRTLARCVKVQATETGVTVGLEGGEFGASMAGETDLNGNPFFKPLTISATVPKGTSLNFNKTHGTITLGEIEGEVKASLTGRSILRAGSLKKIALTLAGRSKAYLSRLEGSADVLMYDSSKVIIDGHVERLRAVVERLGQMEILAPIKRFQAEVNGQGLIHAKNTVTAAQCTASGTGYIRIAELKTYLVGSRRGLAKIEVIKKPAFVPVVRTWGKRRATGSKTGVS